MLALFRRFLGTWVARVFFVVLIGSFALWGVADVVRNLGGDDGSVAKVDGVRIEMADAQTAYRRQLAQVTRMFGGKIEPTPEIRRSVAEQAVAMLVSQTAIDAEARSLGLATPDESVRQAVFEVPQFRGPNGQFDRATFEGLLRNNNMTEPQFLGLIRSDLMRRQLLSAVRAGAAAPETLTQAVFAFQQERRVADMVEVPYATAPIPPAPAAAALERWYDNHPRNYSTAEMRRIKAVVLAPAIVGRDIEVSDEELHAAYEQRRADYNKPEKRSVEVLNTQDEAHAATLAATWRAGADWATMLKAAPTEGGVGVELADSAKIEFPAPELGEAVFAAKLDAITGPVHSALGWHVLKVTKITGGAGRTFDDVKDELRARVIADKAADLIDARAQKIEDLLAGGTSLDDLPGDLGLAAVAGTLDAQGMTAAGQPAPIPGPPELRPALLQAAFQAKPGAPAHLVQAPNAADGSQSFFAVTVESVVPPAPKPYAEVAAAVLADWTHDAERHEQDEAATRIFVAVKGGQSLADAATIAGVAMRQTPPIGRASPVEGVPSQLVEPLFSLKKGEATMIETPDGFVVAVLAEIVEADPKTDALAYGKTRDALAQAMGDDIENVFATAVRERARPSINRAAVDSLAQASE